MSIRRLEWDSAFFGTDVYAADLEPGTRAGDLTRLRSSLNKQNAGLTYLFLASFDPETDSGLRAAGAVLYDEKITYAKTLDFTGPTALSPNVGSIRGEIKPELLKLALLAGHESRFKKDPRLTGRFEDLYTLWLRNSLNGSFADRVFVYRADERILGFITCKVTAEGKGSIGLIATAGHAQGHGIGQKLLAAVDDYYRTRGITFSSVVTQGSNSQACRFYERAGFTVSKKEFVYHWWLK